MTDLPKGLLPLETKIDTPILEILNEFLNTNQFARETIRGYKRYISLFLVKLGVHSQTYAALLKMSPSQIYGSACQFMDEYKNVDPQTDQIHNPRTINYIKFALTSFFKFLILHYDYPPKNPIWFLDRLPTPSKSKTQDLTESEVLKILFFMMDQASKDFTQARNFLFVMGLVIEGCRRKELANLRWDEINFEVGYYETIQKGGFTKISPIPFHFLVLLSQFRDTYGATCPYVFHPIQNNRCKVLAKPISGNYAYKVVTATAKKVVPGKKITPHCFRVTLATLGEKWGLSKRRIKNAGGWSTRGMVDYYIRDEVLENNAVHDIASFLVKNKIFAGGNPFLVL